MVRSLQGRQDHPLELEKRMPSELVLIVIKIDGSWSRWTGNHSSLLGRCDKSDIMQISCYIMMMHHIVYSLFFSRGHHGYWRHVAINKKRTPNSKLTSKLLFSYSFIAVMHWCLVLMLVVTPLFIMVSWPLGGLNGTVVPTTDVTPISPKNLNMWLQYWFQISCCQSGQLRIWNLNTFIKVYMNS